MWGEGLRANKKTTKRGKRELMETGAVFIKPLVNRDGYTSSIKGGDKTFSPIEEDRKRIVEHGRMPKTIEHRGATSQAHAQTRQPRRDNYYCTDDSQKKAG